MKEVLYNPGGHVAHITIPLSEQQSFDALVVAASIADANGGRVERLYHDSDSGQRTRVLGVERAGLVLEPGTMEERDELLKQVDVLREQVDELRAGIEEYLLWQPRKAGHAEAHRRLAALVRSET